MLTSLVIFVARKCKKIQKIDENRQGKNSYLLRDLMNFNEAFGKTVTYDDIKSD